jgi:pyruvate kinase
MSRKTKIVATIGPASEVPMVLEQIIPLGGLVCRLNMSHGNHEEHGAKYANIKNAITKTGVNAEILMDLCGPKIRTTNFGGSSSGKETIVAGSTVTVQYGETDSTATHLYINYKTIVEELSVGYHIMIDDGKVDLVIREKTADSLICEVIYGGTIKSRRGVNLPGAYLKTSAITEKDKNDLAFGLTLGIDYAALSFVRTAADIAEMRQILSDAGHPEVKIVAKLETAECMEHLDSIIAATDVVMIARGDLGVEIGHHKVPAAAMEMYKYGKKHGKPVIMATQLLESMADNAAPLRAEVSDIAHAVWDGAWGCMMSAESATGSFPVETVTMMHNTIVEAEEYQEKNK